MKNKIDKTLFFSGAVDGQSNGYNDHKNATNIRNTFQKVFKF